jgi:radical SAM/Cys-rich protein
MEIEWKRELKERHGVEFDALYTITNMPISRYLEWLEKEGRLEEYLALLANAFNPAAVDGLMCRHTLSVGYDGRLYDCDFNQMLELGLVAGMPESIFEYNGGIQARRVHVGRHCFGCTAGAGSGCSGATA